jgi:hypothetical protein
MAALGAGTLKMTCHFLSTIFPVLKFNLHIFKKKKKKKKKNYL